jgi:hypothetical protein
MKFLRGELAAKQALLEVFGPARAGPVEVRKQLHFRFPGKKTKKLQI